MAKTLDELKSLGANSFAIHPYARIMNDGHVRFRVVDNQRHITVPLDWAQERGMSVMVVPHIAYWGSKFSWRGEINFERAEEWDNFFTDYETWIVEMARLAEAHHAAVFCVGLEFTHAQKFADRWLKIIAAVRAVYYGKLTYGANWNEYDTVKFWDALDYLGVLAYFPLCKADNPSVADLAAAWEKRGAELERFSKRNGGKQFVFVEIGYNENAKAAAEPWSFATGGEHAREIQERCLEAALSLTGKTVISPGCFFGNGSPSSRGMRRRISDCKLRRSKRSSRSIGNDCRQLHLAPELFLQLGARDLDHRRPAVRATIGQLALQQIADQLLHFEITQRIIRFDRVPANRFRDHVFAQPQRRNCCCSRCASHRSLRAQTAPDPRPGEMSAGCRS